MDGETGGWVTRGNTRGDEEEDGLRKAALGMSKRGGRREGIWGRKRRRAVRKKLAREDVSEERWRGR